MKAATSMARGDTPSQGRLRTMRTRGPRPMPGPPGQPPAGPPPAGGLGPRRPVALQTPEAPPHGAWCPAESPGGARRHGRPP
eukprot:1255787-Lingulodinium_polyedra.AAC.1